MLFAHRTLVASVLLLTTDVAPSGYELAWTPAEGQQIERQFVLDLEIDFKSGGFEVMGEQLPMEELYEAFDGEVFERNLDIEVTAVDTIQALELDRVTVIDRRFESLTIDGVEDDEGPSLVRFTWDQRRDRFQVEILDETDLDPFDAEASRRILREDLDCRWLLPDGEVEDASTWQHQLTPQQALELVGIPGIDVGALFLVGMEEDTEDPEILAAFEPVIESLGQGRRSGRVDAELTGTRVENGQTIAQVALSVEVELHLDIADSMVASIEQEALEDEPLPEHVRAMILISGEGDGLFEWNVTAGRLERIETDLEYVFEINGGFELDFEGETMPFSGWASWGGTLSTLRTVATR